MKTRHVDTELRPFHSHFMTVARTHGSEKVFSDFLTIALTQFSLPSCTVSKEMHAEAVASYNDNEKKAISEMFREMILTYDRMVNHDKAWFDFFGDFYQELASKSKSQFFGQFFTPEHMCELMAILTDGSDEPMVGKWINDPACGSGRLLLAHHVRNLGNFYVGEDLDLICCKMSALNFLMHGVVGEIWCHNSITEPDTYRYKFVINTRLNGSLPFPHVQIFRDGNLDSRFACKSQEVPAELIFANPPKKKKGNPQQLSFFSIVFKPTE